MLWDSIGIYPIQLPQGEEGLVRKDLGENLMLKLMSDRFKKKKKKNRRQGAKIMGHKDIKTRKKATAHGRGRSSK